MNPEIDALISNLLIDGRTDELYDHDPIAWSLRLQKARSALEERIKALEFKARVADWLYRDVLTDAQLDIRVEARGVPTTVRYIFEGHPQRFPTGYGIDKGPKFG